MEEMFYIKMAVISENVDVIENFVNEQMKVLKLQNV